MLPKHVHIDWNLQWRLKSSISFIFSYIFYISYRLLKYLRIPSDFIPIKFKPPRIKSWGNIFQNDNNLCVYSKTWGQRCNFSETSFLIFFKNSGEREKNTEAVFKDVLGTRRSRNLKKKRKLASLGKNLGNFLEKCIWKSSSVVKL